MSKESDKTAGTMTLDVSKPVQTRDGHKARIICTDRRGGVVPYPIVALVEVDNLEMAFAYKSDGSFSASVPNDLDLINVPTKREGWINIYSQWGFSGIYDTKAEADEMADTKRRMACVRVEWEEP